VRSPFKRVLYGRGCASKGAALAFLHAVAAIREVEGRLPVNVMFLQEGEEFLGSPHVAELIERHHRELSRADAVLWPGLCQETSGDPTIFLGNKGCLKVEITCSSERWGRGPQGAAAHGSTQGVVDHPVWRLVHALATLYDPQHHRILVDGFYDGQRPPSPAQLALIDALATRYKGRETTAIPGIGPVARVNHFVDDIGGAEVFRRFCFEPTMNIDGLCAGFTGPGTPGWTLPRVATCSIDHRLPPDLTPQSCLDKLRTHLDRHGYEDLELRTLMMVEAQTIDAQAPLVQAAFRMFTQRGLDPIVWPRRGLSGPEAHFNRLLGLPVVGSTGLGYATGHAAPDEFIVIEGDGRVGGLVELTQSFVDLIYAFAST
jgi:acetylornithine deacetylase/succinyl-diaminopimelate desuccinylase-like protein